MDEINIFDFFDIHDEYKQKLSSDWKWSMREDYPKTNGLKVFSCFSCGGGSTMGYKLAGCEVVGNCEIDPEMNAVYLKNHHPKYNYLMDIREFNALPAGKIPSELFDLDILDGSPPCTTFSMAGQREKNWGKEKKFREGQKKQTLDDLSFVFIDTVKKLRPKVVIMENVEGLLFGNAWEYVKKIYSQLEKTGYKVNHWVLKGEEMGVPQKRHRIFFVCIRNDIRKDPHDINMVFNYAPVTYGEIKSGAGEEINHDTQSWKMVKMATHKHKNIADVYASLCERERGYSNAICWDEDVLPTITAQACYYRGGDATQISVSDVISAQTFPTDYDFMAENPRKIKYICGMSVPPIMIKRIVTRLIDQGVFNYKLKEAKQ